jgi:hypothetical protein
MTFDIVLFLLSLMVQSLIDPTARAPGAPKSAMGGSGPACGEGDSPIRMDDAVLSNILGMRWVVKTGKKTGEMNPEDSFASSSACIESTVPVPVFCVSESKTKRQPTQKTGLRDSGVQVNYP